MICAIRFLALTTCFYFIYSLDKGLCISHSLSTWRQSPPRAGSGAVDTWVQEALNVLHHQLAGQTDGMLEVSRCHIPVGVILVATTEPQGHHRKKKVNDRIDSKPWAWWREGRGSIVISWGGGGSCHGWYQIPLPKDLPSLQESVRRIDNFLEVIMGAIFLFIILAL